MIKFNRIGNKLGLAGAIGVLLAVGMVANQMMSEAEVEAAGGRVARSQRVIDSALAGRSNCGRCRLLRAISGLPRRPPMSTHVC